MNPTFSATALIAEDEPLLAEHLHAELARLWPGLRVVARAGDGVTALAQALALAPQILFLDIRMPGASGIEVVERLADDWPGAAHPDAPFPLIVFATAYDQYALKAFEHAAVDYLLKPVDTARLARACERLQERLAGLAATGDAPVPAAASGGMPAPEVSATLGLTTAAGAPAANAATPSALDLALEQLRRLAAFPPATGGSAPGAAAPRLRTLQAAVGSTIHFVPVEQVVYFEAADKYVRVVTAGREHLVRTSLRELLPQLDPEQFWQVHRGTVVRADAIASAERDEAGRYVLTLVGHPDRLAVSRLYAHRFKAM